MYSFLGIKTDGKINSSSRKKSSKKLNNSLNSSLYDNFQDTLDQSQQLDESYIEDYDFNPNASFYRNSITNNTIDNRVQTPTQQAISENLAKHQAIHNKSGSLVHKPELSSLSRSPSRSPSPKMSEHALNVAYNHARGYLNMFKRSGVGKWFDETIKLFNDAQVPTKTYLFDILTVCNTHLPPERTIEWSDTLTNSTAKQLLIDAFAVSNEERIKTALDPNSWKNKTFLMQLKELTDAFGSNYALKKEFLMKRFPTIQQTMAFTKIQQLEADSAITEEDKLKQLVTYMDSYNISYPVNKDNMPAVCSITPVVDSYVSDQAKQLQLFQDQKDEIVQSITQNVISSIQAMNLNSNKGNHNEAKRNDNYYQSNKYGQNKNYQDNYGRNNRNFNNRQFDRRYDGPRSNNKPYNGQRQQRPPSYGGNYQNRRAPNTNRPINVCSEHMDNGANYRASKCAAGCRFHPAKLCYGHAKFGARAWKDNCEPFCKKFHDQKNL